MRSFRHLLFTDVLGIKMNFIKIYLNKRLRLIVQKVMVLTVLSLDSMIMLILQ